MSSRSLSLATAAMCALALLSCQREKQQLRPEPAQVAVFGSAARESDLQPGGRESQPQVTNPFHGEADAISQGQRLFSWYNCTGCHANGGGAIGPPLIKMEWIYGEEPSNLFDTIVKGRPNGMPAWGGKIPEYQIWQLVAYIRSLNGLEPQSATPKRQDHIEATTETRP
jgi:cytochrome c oxidase cbb3-type subunit III